MPTDRTGWKTLSIPESTYRRLSFIAKVRNRKLSGQVKELIDQEFLSSDIKEEAARNGIGSLA